VESVGIELLPRQWTAFQSLLHRLPSTLQLHIGVRELL
jgi:hypothetical protein